MPFLSALPTVDPQSVVDGATLWNNGFKNYLINGDFEINQRAFAGGALAAGIYGFDRWKAGTGSCNISLSAGVLTHTSGPLVQVVEAPNLAGKTIAVSVDGLSGGNLSVSVEGVAGVIVAAAGRSGVSIAVPGTSTGNVTVTLTPASGAVTYKRVQVELGSVATAFEWRPAALELDLCARYFQFVFTNQGDAFVMAVAYGTTNAIGYLYLPTPMRIVPSSVTTGVVTMTPPGATTAGSGAISVTMVSNQIAALLVTLSGLTVGSAGYFSAQTNPQTISIDAEL